MGLLLKRTTAFVLGFVSLFNAPVSVALARSRSVSYRPLGLVSTQETASDDFFLKYLKEMYREDERVQSFGPLRNKGFLEWVPDGSMLASVPSECLPEAFEKKAQRANMPASEYGQLVKDYFNHCGATLNANALGGLVGLIDFAMASYPFLENSLIRPMKFKAKDGGVVNGFIGIKDKTPRPWVIYKCGVFCAAEPNSASLKNFVIHLFDQAPFNIILLGNRTGEDYIVANQRFNFGGFFEHQDFIDIAQWLRTESPYASLVSSVHIVAVSLAGSAAYLTEHRLSAESKSQPFPIQSVTSLCAVSDLKPTVENMYGDSLKGFIFSRLTWHKLQSVRSALPGAADLLSGDQPDNQYFPGLLGQLATRFMPPESQVFADGLLPNKFDDRERYFWEKSHYSSYRHRAPIPLFVWASEDDSVVDFKINTGTLMKVKANNNDPNVAVVGVPAGEHCGFATAYGYPVVASILRSFILNNSPEFKLANRVTQLSVQAPSDTMIEGERIIGYWWSMGKNENDKFRLNFEIYGADNSLCPEEDAFHGAENCRRTVTVKVPQDFFRPYGFLDAKTTIEKEALVREMNVRITLTHQNETIVGTSHWPDQLQVRYF